MEGMRVGGSINHLLTLWKKTENKAKDTDRIKKHY